MKIRKGFVSNSSSSSFCLFGFCIDSDVITKYAELLTKDEIDEHIKNNKWVTEETFDPNSDEYDSQTTLDLIISKAGEDFSVEYGGEGALYIGRVPETLKDEESGKQFKESVEKLKKIIPELGTPGWFMEVVEG